VWFPAVKNYGLDCERFIGEHTEFMKSFGLYITFIDGLVKTKNVTESDIQKAKDGMKEIKVFLFPHLAAEQVIINRKWIEETIPKAAVPKLQKTVEDHGKSGRPECFVMMLRSCTPQERKVLETILPWFLRKIILPFILQKKVRDCSHLFIDPIPK